MSEKKPNKTSRERLDTNEKYIQQLDDIKIRVPKGSRAKIREYADSQGISINQLVIRAIQADAEEHEYKNAEGEKLVIPVGVRDVPTEKKHDRIPVFVDKGKREIIKAYAASKGQSVNDFINSLLHDAIPELASVDAETEEN